MRRAVATLAGAWMIGLAGCLLGGGSSEQGNALVEGRVVDSGGVSVSGARVLVIDGSNWLGRVRDGRSVILDSARTDAKGRFNLRLNLGGRINLQVDGPGLGRLDFDAQTRLGPGRQSWVLTALPLGSAQGTVISRGAAAVAVRIPGTAYRSAIRPDGAYAFPGLPQGRYTTMVHLGSETDAVETPGQSLRVESGVITLRDLAVARDEILVEDFAGLWPRSRLSALTGWGNWHAVVDSIHPGQRSRLEHALVEGAESLDGPSLRMGVVLDSSYAGVGLQLGRLEGYDLSGLKALRFMAKGRGKIRVSVESAMLDSLGEDQFERIIELPAEWDTVSIPVDSLRLPSGSEPERLGLAWGAAGRSIVRVEFLAVRPSTAPGDSVLFWMDDLVLEGASLDDFVR